MEPLYRGPLGVVSKARCETKGGRFDAITQLDERLDLDAVYEALDARMVRVGALRSPLLVRDKGLVEVDGKVCLASVLVDGVPLRHVVGIEPLPPRVACGIGSKIARALHSAYDRVPRRKRRPYGLIHGDLGPDDILLGENGDLRLANVGWKESAPIARPDPLRALVLHPTAWAAPETAEQKPTHAADVYSLMALLAWMVTGKVPSYASTESSWHEGVVESTAEAVRAASGEAAMAELVAWGMARDPIDRPRAEEVYGWLDKLTRTLPGPQWPSLVEARLGTARADAIESTLGLDDDASAIEDAPPPAGMDWTVEQNPGSGDEPEVPWDSPPAPVTTRPPPVSIRVASVVFDPQRRAMDLSAVLPRAEAGDDEELLGFEDPSTDIVESDESSFDEEDSGELVAPPAFGGLAEVSLEARDDRPSAGLALGSGDDDDDGGFVLAIDSDSDLDDETEEAADAWSMPDSTQEAEPEVLKPAGATIRVQVGGGVGRSSWGRDDLTGIDLPEHLFRDDSPSRSVPPTQPPVREAPLRGIRVTMPVHEDNLDGFVFQGSEEDAIAATTGRGRQHLRLVEEDPPKLPPPPEPSGEPLPAPPVVPAAPRTAPAPPSYAPPRPPREVGGSPFLWAVGLASALILGIMAANPLIQSIRTPATPPSVRPSVSKRISGPADVVSPEAMGELPPEPELVVEPVPEPVLPAAAASVEPLPEPEPAPEPAPEPPPEPASTPTAPAPVPAASSSKRRSSRPPKKSTPPPAPPPSSPPPPEPPPSEPAPPPVASAGTVQVRGDAFSVQLIGSGGTFRAGEVPAGRYTIQAVFGPGTPMVAAGSVVVRDGAAVTVECNSMFMACKVR